MKVIAKILLRISALYKLFWYPINFLLFKINSVTFAKFPSISGFVQIRNRGNFSIGSHVTITSRIQSNPVGGRHRSFFYVSPKAYLTIGNNVGISNAIIFAKKNIVIEDDVLIGGGVQIYDSDFHSLNYDDRMMRPDPSIKSKNIHIKKGAFIGAGALILKGVTIGENSIIAAGSVLSKGVPDNQIWGGNPAKFIRNV